MVFHIWYQCKYLSIQFTQYNGFCIQHVCIVLQHSVYSQHLVSYNVLCTIYIYQHKRQVPAINFVISVLLVQCIFENIFESFKSLP